MDRGDGYYNGPVLPLGITYDGSSTIGQHAQRWANPEGGIVVAWRGGQGWYVNMFEISKVDKATESTAGNTADDTAESAAENTAANAAGGTASAGDGTLGEGTIHWTDSDDMPQGGWQGGRGWQLNGTDGTVNKGNFYVENIFEELDAPSEWFFSKSQHKLYLWYNSTTGSTPPPKTLGFIATSLKEMIGIRGSMGAPVSGEWAPSAASVFSPYKY
jgi:hypothetical protein